ncbi:MAG: hypothetical protein ACKO15_13170, partial [Burkholderiales bacterium]
MMTTKFLILLVAVNTVASHLLLKSVVGKLAKPDSFATFFTFLIDAATRPTVWASLALQVVGYGVWMAVISQEKLGAATAAVSACYYLLTAAAAWFVFGEQLAAAQWAGIVLVTCGVI